MQYIPETRFRNILDNLQNGYVYARIVYDEHDRAIDLVHEEVNAGYYRLTGLENVVGRRLLEVMPGITDSNPHFIGKLLDVARSGIADRFESYHEEMNRWFDNSVYCPKEGWLVSIFHDITARKLAEQALSENRERFSATIEAARIGTWDWSVQTGEVIVNDYWTDIVGYSIEELEPLSIQTWIDLVHPDDLILSNSLLEKHFSGELSSYECECRMKHKNGHWVWVMACGKVLTRTADGRPLRMFGTHTDITGRKMAEDALKESEERFRSMFQDHSAIMMLLDTKTCNIIDVNKAAIDFYGWPADELKRMNMGMLSASSTKEVLDELHKWKSQERRSVSLRHRRADGSVRDVEIFAKLIKVMGSTLIYDVIHDVTDRKRLEAFTAMRIHLLEQARSLSVEQLLQLAVDEIEKVTDSSIAFVFSVDEHQEFLSLQTASTSTFEHGHKAHRTGVRYCLDNVGPWVDVVRERKSVICNDHASAGYRNGLPYGHATVTRELVVPVVRGGVVTAVVGVGNKPSDYDQDDVKWVEMAVDQVWEIIEKKMAEEARSRMEEQLHHAKKMEMVGQLASGIAHEINNPLNFITINNETQKAYFADFLALLSDYRNMARSLESGNFDASELHRLHLQEEELGIDVLVHEIRDIFAETDNGIRRVKKIVAGMRSLSYRGTDDKKTFSDINKGILETLNIARHEYRFCADISTSLDELPLIHCIPDQINQVLLNLIVNSAHAIQSQQRSSKGRISIHTWSDNSNVYCSIADDGPGMPDQIREKIFNSFFTTKKVGKGTGLGLSISWDIIVNKHNGSFSVECPSDGGTVFTFSLPQNITFESQESNEKSD